MKLLIFFLIYLSRVSGIPKNTTPSPNTDAISPELNELRRYLGGCRQVQVANDMPSTSGGRGQVTPNQAPTTRMTNGVLREIPFNLCEPGPSRVSQPVIQNEESSSKLSDDEHDKSKQRKKCSKKSFSCELCGKSFNHKHSLKGHMTTHDDRGPYSCEFCPKVLMFRGHFEKHLRRYHSDSKPLLCDQCGKSFESTQDLRNHRRVHLDKKRFSCKLCGKSYKYNQDLKEHEISHLDEGAFNCKLCDRTFHTPSELKKHTRIHEDNSLLHCEHCKKRFKTKSRFAEHMFYAHAKGKLFRCNFCSSCFGTQSELLDHERTHLNERPHVCDHCDRSFKRPQELRKHKMIHTGERPFQCDICAKCFNSKSHLNQHKKIHEKTKLFECERCCKCFKNMGAFKQHMKSHAKDEPCDESSSGALCPESSVKESDLDSLVGAYDENMLQEAEFDPGATALNQGDLDDLFATLEQETSNERSQVKQIIMSQEEIDKMIAEGVGSDPINQGENLGHLLRIGQENADECPLYNLRINQERINTLRLEEITGSSSLRQEDSPHDLMRISLQMADECFPLEPSVNQQQTSRSAMPEIAQINLPNYQDCCDHLTNLGVQSVDQRSDLQPRPSQGSFQPPVEQADLELLEAISECETTPTSGPDMFTELVEMALGFHCDYMCDDVSEVQDETGCATEETSQSDSGTLDSSNDRQQRDMSS